MRPKLRKIIKITCAIFALLMVLFLSIAYIQYRELKKILVVKISDKTTALIGQKVEIGDLSFSPSAGINLYNITVKNSEGFAAGDLLRIKKIFIKMKYGDLPRGRLYFSNITVYSPELSVLRDDQGRMNISDKLMNLFKRKTTLTYQIDGFDIESGSFDFRGIKTNIFNSGGEGGLPDKLFRNDNISVRIKNLSSKAGIKTSMSGHTIIGGSEIAFHGWAHLTDDPKKLNISISSKDVSLVPLKQLLGRYGVSAEKTKMTFSLNSEGDTEKGFRVKSEIRIKEAGFKFFTKNVKELLLNIQAFLNIRDSSITLENISLQTGKSTAATVRGKIRDLFNEPSYTAELKIGSLDLSAFNFVKGLNASGTMTSDNIHIHGHFTKSLPAMSGDVRLKDAALTSKDDDIKKINATLKFVSNGKMTVRAEVTAKLSKARGYLLDKPADVGLLLSGRGNPQSMSLKSSVNLSPVETHFKGGKIIFFNSIVFNMDGNMKDKAFDGKSRIEAKDISFTGHRVPWLSAVSSFEYRGNVFTAISPAAEGEYFKTSAERVTIRLPEKERKEKRITVEIEGMNASYPEKEAGLKKADISLHLDTGGDSLSGDFGFSLSGIMFRGLHAAAIAGSGAFDGKKFSVDIPEAEVSGGNIQLALTGRTAEGPFPAEINAVAENIDIGDMPNEALRISGISYDISGELKSAAFAGTLYSVESIQGKAAVRAEKVALRKKDDKQNLLKDVLLTGTMEFRGKDFDFKADAGIGNIATSISGTTKNFLQKNKSVDVKVKLPGVKAADIRDSLWDIFPDSLLYAGLGGSLSSDLSIAYSDEDLKVDGRFAFQDLALQGENGEYSVGPINGALPIAYSRTGGKEEMIDMLSFDRSEFSDLRRYYSQKTFRDGYSRITIGSLQYGFKFIENIDLLVKQKGSVLNIGRFSGTIFGGRLNGTAVLDLSSGVSYRVGMIVEGLSLSKLCEGIEPIKGYISGKADGTAIVKGSGSGVAQAIGKADFWTYGTTDEKTKISKEFLQKMGGTSLKSYLGDRPFDKGEMGLYLQDGFVIFKELEISHKNIFGMTDLSIRVAPFNNRIATDHLLWSITEAAQRAKEK